MAERTIRAFEVVVQRTINAPQSSFAFDRPRIGEVARRAAVLVVVVAPFIATAVAIVQLWQWAVTWRDLALLEAV